MSITLCNQCWQDYPALNRQYHSGTEYYFCDECLAANLWDCPECDRTFYIGLNQQRLPRHYRNTDEIDFRMRRVREVCPGWKSSRRIAAEKRFGFNTRIPSAKTQRRAI